VSTEGRFVISGEADLPIRSNKLLSLVGRCPPTSKSMKICASGNGIFLRIWKHTWLLIYLTSPAFCVSEQGQANQKLPVLTNALQVRRLSVEQAKCRFPVQLHGVVTYYDPSWNMLFFQDSTAGLFVATRREKLPASLRSGQLIELGGVAAPGDFAPVVVDPSVKILGHSEYPPAHERSFGEMITGKYDCHWVEVIGIIHSAIVKYDRLNLEISSPYGTLGVQVFEFTGVDLTHMVDAKARLLGVCGTTSNEKRQVVGISLFVPSLKEVQVLEPPPSDPFSLSVTPIAHLLQQNPGLFTGHRVHVKGTTSLQEGRDLFWMHDNSGSLLVQLDRSSPLVSRGEIEVVGFPSLRSSKLMLEHASCRSLEQEKDSSQIGAIGSVGLAAQQAAALPTLNHVEQVRGLKPEQAALGYPVRLQATVTYVDYAWGNLFVQDSTGGIFVQGDNQAANLKRGELVEVIGVSSEGDFAPTVVSSRIRVLGQGEQPVARPVSFEHLFSGKEDSQWVEVRGVVRSIRKEEDHLYLEIVSGGGRFKAEIPGFSGTDLPLYLVDAGVAIHGACATNFNQKRQLTGFRVLIPELGDIQIEEPAPQNLTSIPLRTIGSLMQFSPQGESGHRVRIQGVVTFQLRDRTLFIKDGDNSLLVYPLDALPVRIGDLVEVFGFPAVRDNRLVLEDAYYQRLGHQELPPPFLVRGEEVLNGNYDANLVRVEGRVLKQVLAINELILTVQDGQAVFTAHYEGEKAESPRGSVIPGSRLSVTGICLVQTDMNRAPQAFRILIRSEEDIVVTEKPPWWTLRHTLWTVSGMILVILMVLAWVIVLRQRVFKQTEVIRARLEREASLEARFRELVENANDIIFTCDLEGQITSLNRSGERTTGYARAEASHMKVYDLLPLKDRERSQERIRRELAGEKYGAREVEIVSKQGEHKDLEVVIQLIYQGSTPIGIQGIARDITARKCAERELLQAKESAEAANHAKSEFLANMSHEIRTPMNGIVGMTELLLGTELTSEQQEYLGMVKASADSLTAIINDILDFSKVEAGKLELEFIPFSLRDILDETVKAFALRAHEKGLELACRIPRDVPDRLVGDTGRLRQILVNLVGNAIKFTEKGEVVVEVSRFVQPNESALTVATSLFLTPPKPGIGNATTPAPPSERFVSSGDPDSCWLRFVVQDTGIGIPAEKRRLIFEAFTQADGSTTRKFGGTGLGLTISSRLVRLMGGELHVESTVGQGSTFIFSARFGLDLDQSTAMAPTAPEHLRSVPVLVVDDNRTHQKILDEVLENWGMQPLNADNGPAALLQLHLAREQGRKIPLVLLNCQMPGMDGLTVAEQVKRTPGLAGIKIILLTPAGKPSEPIHLCEPEIAGYLIKPVKQSELLEAILRAMSGPQVEPSEQEAHALVPVSCQPRRVLLAEDNVINQRLVVRLLEKQGYSVRVANNGLEALVAWRQETFDLALMDVQMPEMNGLETTESIRKSELLNGGHLPIIAMTAHAMKGDRERCLEAGMDAYLPKPIQARELMIALENLMPVTGSTPDWERISEEVRGQGQPPRPRG
jgi:two-component system sensor histidine kinase/response regulator